MPRRRRPSFSKPSQAETQKKAAGRKILRDFDMRATPLGAVRFWHSLTDLSRAIACRISPCCSPAGLVARETLWLLESLGRGLRPWQAPRAIVGRPWRRFVQGPALLANCARIQMTGPDLAGDSVVFPNAGELQAEVASPGPLALPVSRRYPTLPGAWTPSLGP